MKQCSKCEEWKELTEFNKNQHWCKLCQEEYRQKHKEEIKIQGKKYREANKETINKKGKIYHQENKEKINNRHRERYQINKKNVNGQHRKYYQEHKKERNEHRKEKRKNNPKYRLNNNISRLINYSLKGNKNGLHWENMVDYTTEDLMIHLKTTLPGGFTWQDFMDGKLQIDHKIPIAKFNFDNSSQLDFRRCWALENLRLLEATMNMSKGAEIVKPFQPNLKI